MALNPNAKSFSPAPINPENNDLTNSEQNRAIARQIFERAAYAANPELQADENLEAFLAWSESQRTKKQTKKGTRGRKSRRNEKKRKQSRTSHA